MTVLELINQLKELNPDSEVRLIYRSPINSANAPIEYIEDQSKYNYVGLVYQYSFEDDDG